MPQPEIRIYRPQRGISPGLGPFRSSEERWEPQEFSYYGERVHLPNDGLGPPGGYQASRFHFCVGGVHYSTEPGYGSCVAAKIGDCDEVSCRDSRSWDEEWSTFAYGYLREVKLKAGLPLPWWDPIREFFQAMLS